MKKILLFSFMLLSALALESWAQERTISGTITSVDDGSSLPGVNVVLKGTTNGTITDVDGNYKLSVPSEGGTLRFSFIGLTTEEIEIGARSVIDLSMSSDVKQLSEVVVSALGVERETKALGYAVQSVNSDDLVKARETNVVNSLSGKIAGAQVTSSSGAVGSSSRIVLRGPSSITGNNQPLFVVDGIPISNVAYGSSNSPFGGNSAQNGAAEINPDDIESITVLKGANAAALYGSRASNGVILITTKSGKGQTDGIGVTVNSTTTFENPLKLPDWQNSYGQGASNQFFEWIDGSAGDGGVDESWGMPLDIGLEAVQWSTNGATPEPWVSQVDNFKDFFETGLTLSNSVALAGASDLGNFRLSLTHMDQKGTLPNTGLERKTVALNSGYNLSEKLRADFSANYVNSFSDNLPIQGYSGANPVQQFIWSGRNVDFNALKDYGNLPISTAGKGDGISPVNWNTRFQNNPFWSNDNLLNTYNKDRLYGNVRLNYKINDWLSIMGRMGTDYFAQEDEDKRAQGIESTTNGDGFYNFIKRSGSETNLDFLVTINKDINDDFNIGFNAGGNMRRERYSSIYVEATNLELPGIFNVSNVKSGVTPVYNNFRSEKRVNSMYFSAQFAWRNSLFLDVTGRNDWSSTLPEENNSYFYPSVTLSAVVTDLANIQSDFLSFLKLRGGWAKVGSDTGPYNLVQTFAFRSPFGTILSPVVGNSLLNPELKPESTVSIEAGVDARFFNGKINLDFTYYKSNTTDQIIPVQITGASGYTSRTTNIGEMQNTGFELQLSATPIEGTITWDVAVNYGKYNNEVIDLGGDLDQLTLGGQWNVDIQARPGQPYGAIFGPAFLRGPDGNIIYENGLPEVDPTFRVIGNTQADWTGSINNSITFKGITLSALVDGKFGGDVYSMTTSWGRYAGVLEETLFGREEGIVGVGVIDNGDGTYRPNDVVVSAEKFNKRSYQNGVAESSIFDGTYVKLRQIQLGYTIPQSVFGGDFPIKDIQISVVGRNLALLYSTVPHIDPETSFSNGNVQGLEFGQIPTNRSIGFNIGFKL